MSNTLPRCPKCLDGGNVTLVEIPSEVSSVFQPLPPGEQQPVCEYRCDCGWSAPADCGPSE